MKRARWWIASILIIIISLSPFLVTLLRNVKRQQYLIESQAVYETLLQSNGVYSPIFKGNKILEYPIAIKSVTILPLFGEFEEKATSSQCFYIKRNLMQSDSVALFDFYIHQGKYDIQRLNILGKQVVKSPDEISRERDFERHQYPRPEVLLGVYSFSYVGFNAFYSNAVFYYQHSYSRWGEGEMVSMAKIDGKWVITGRLRIWVS